MDLKEIQKRVYQHKVNRGFNVTNVEKEFCLLYGEVAEAFDAYRKKKDDVDQELADVAIYLLSIAEILKIDLYDAIINKMMINEKRVYKEINGVTTRIEG